MDLAARERYFKWLADRSGEIRTAFKFGTHYYRENNPSEENKYDFFPSNRKSDKLAIYIHGGRWQISGLSSASFLAEYFLANNFNFAGIGFDLCTEVSVTEMIRQVRQAIKKIMENHPDQKHVYLLGHSSGAHLTLAALVCDWLEDDLAFTPSEKERLVRAVIISGTYDMRKICDTPLNDVLKLTPTEAAKNSPILFAKHIGSFGDQFKILILVEEKDDVDFHVQAKNVYEELKPFLKENSLHHDIIEGVTHYTIISRLGDKDYELTDRILRFFNE